MRVLLLLGVLGTTAAAATTSPPIALQDVLALRGDRIMPVETASGADAPRFILLAGPDGRPDPVQAPRPQPPPPDSADVKALRERLQKLEKEVARLRGSVPQDAKTGVTYGPVPHTTTPIPGYTGQASVLAERGVPSRMEWGPKGRVLYYGRERWSFDDKGQLLSVQRDP